MNRVLRRLTISAIVVAALLGVGLWFIDFRAHRTFAAPYPAITATSDSATVELGRYLVYGPAACAYCHVLREQWKELVSTQASWSRGRPCLGARMGT